MIDEFYVVTVISNPVRYQSRYRLYQEFKERMERAGAKLFTVECAFGERPFEVTEAGNPMNLQIRSYDEIWHKENMINLGIQRLPATWKYVAWVDSDIQFVRDDWKEETVHKLQHHMVVQMWQNALDLGPTGEALGIHRSFISEYIKAGCNAVLDKDGCYAKWHPGYAWAARREAIDHLGGLIDVGILGSGDRHMAGALIGAVGNTYNSRISDGYKKYLDIWQRQAELYVRRDVGFVPGTVLHGWHGRKVDRGYASRWEILVKYQYDPYTDIKRDNQGLYQLVDHGDARSNEMRDAIRAYFRSRSEDSIDLV